MMTATRCRAPPVSAAPCSTTHRPERESTRATATSPGDCVASAVRIARPALQPRRDPPPADSRGFDPRRRRGERGGAANPGRRLRALVHRLYEDLYRLKRADRLLLPGPPLDLEAAADPDETTDEAP